MADRQWAHETEEMPKSPLTPRGIRQQQNLPESISEMCKRVSDAALELAEARRASQDASRRYEDCFGAFCKTSESLMLMLNEHRDGGADG